MLTITQPKPTSQQIERRAAELGAMNGNREPADAYQALAQEEAASGNTHHWVWLCDGNMLANLKPRYESAKWDRGSTENRSELFAQISAL